MDKFRKIFIRSLNYLLIITISTIVFINLVFLTFKIVTKKQIYSSADDIPASYTVLVPGAMVWSSGKLSGFLEDRMNNALVLYRAGKAKRFLLSGDHGDRYYDEVNAMKKYLIAKGIPEEDIFLDHNGFDTYSSIVRAHEIYEVDDMIVVTQKFHLPRALFIAKYRNIKATGFIADQRKYKEIKYLRFREKLANIKALYEVLFHRNIEYEGDKIPITGDSTKTYK